MNGNELRIASYNVHKGVGTDYRRDPLRTVAVLREIGADIIALQEVDRRFGDRAGVLDLERIMEETDLAAVPLGQRLGVRSAGWHGNLLLVRGAEVENAFPLTLPGLEPRGAIVADLRIAGQPLRVISAHMGLLRQSRLEQARFLADRIGGDDGRPTILMGDFNEWRLGANCGLMPLRRGLRAVKRSAQTVASFPAQRPVLPLDRIIGCRRAEVSQISPHDTPLSRRASDHLPVTAQLRLAP